LGAKIHVNNGGVHSQGHHYTKEEPSLDERTVTSEPRFERETTHIEKLEQLVALLCGPSTGH